jgi:hypothetical protein
MKLPFLNLLELFFSFAQIEGGIFVGIQIELAISELVIKSKEKY